MVSIGTAIIIFLVAVIVVPAIIWFFIWWNSFRHKVWIAKQSGKDESDVIWIEDKCKVIDKRGEHIIVFRGHKGNSPSFTGEFWTKAYKNKASKITDEQWNSMTLSKSLGRGLFLYQSTEGEFHPMRIVSEGQGKKSFQVLSQDNRGFLIRSLSDNNELTLSSRRQMIIYLAVAGAFIILAILFVMWLIYITESANNLCGVVGNKFIDTAQNVVGG